MMNIAKSPPRTARDENVRTRLENPIPASTSRPTWKGSRFQGVLYGMAENIAAAIAT
jgi:hypothetical protein